MSNELTIQISTEDPLIAIIEWYGNQTNRVKLRVKQINKNNLSINLNGVEVARVNEYTLRDG